MAKKEKAKKDKKVKVKVKEKRERYAYDTAMSLLVVGVCAYTVLSCLGFIGLIVYAVLF